MPHRCAFGCKATDVVMHVFPNPQKYPERFKTWVNLVGGDFQTLSDNEIYKKKRICDIHFTNNHRNRFKRLNELAVPSLHLANTSRATDATTAIEVQSVVSLPVNAPVTLDASRAQESFAAVEMNIPPVASLPVIIDHDKNDNTCLSINLLAEHNYSAASKPRSRGSLPDAGKPSFSICTKPLQKKIRYLQNEISRLRKKGKSFKERLANATQLSANVTFQRVVERMTKPAQLFMHMQLQSNKKPKGRRFTTEQKILSLSMYKKSPKCYRLLCKYFTLPSNRAMKRLLGEIKIGPGVNKILFEKIKKNIMDKKKSDRLCSLIFDEMSITPQLFYTAHKDRLEGFSSNANTFADHVLVFMAKGVKNNFKQPIAYYFTNSLNKIELKKLLR